MNLRQMIEFIKVNPNVPITHFLFASYEHIVSKKDGNVYDENGYLFENWDSVTDMWSGWNGIRMRSGGMWEYGWRVKE